MNRVRTLLGVLRGRLAPPDHARRLGRRGSVTITFAASLLLLLAAGGAGIDLMRAYGDEQKLSEVATLACQYATRPSVIQTASTNYAGSGSLGSFDANVKAFVASALHTQFPAGSASYGVTPVISGSPGSLMTIALASSSANTFMGMFGYSSVPLAATAQCFATTAPPQVNNNNTLIREDFANSYTNDNVIFVMPNGSRGYQSGVGAIPLHTSFPATPAFTGANGSQWYVMGYCLEFDQASNSIEYTSPGGGWSAELDCDNGSSNGGNSSISTQIYLEIGNYELRYFYAGRVEYPNYDPAYLCGSSANDLSWANDATTGSFWVGTAAENSARSNQINVYLDVPTASGAPPTHATLDGQTLAGSNLIDECVYSPPNHIAGGENNPVWIQRSVRVVVATPGFYWLSFAADGHSDSYGGQLADIVFCQGTCPGAVQDNFPSVTYNPYYPGGTIDATTQVNLPDWLNTTVLPTGLFYESFESPANAQNSGHDTYQYQTAGGTITSTTSGVLNYSTGTFGTAASGWPGASAAAGWPSAASPAVTPSKAGWAIAPQVAINYASELSGTTYAGFAASGSQYVELSLAPFPPYTSAASIMISRPFLLVPGYYNLSYRYFANLILTYSGTICGSTPAAAGASSGHVGTGVIRYTSAQVNVPVNINYLGVFLSNAQLVSTPNMMGTYGAITTYSNPDPSLADTPPVRSTSTTPKVPPDAISLANYQVSSTSALLDFCADAQSWTARSINFSIAKPGYYWLTFSSQMTDQNVYGNGAGIDAITLSALGSLAMPSPPATYVPVPVGNPQPSRQQWASDNSFYIMADPPTFPAPQQ
jgi:hypothetical protein